MLARAQGEDPAPSASPATESKYDPNDPDWQTLKRIQADGKELDARLEKMRLRSAADRQAARDALAFIRMEDDSVPPPTCDWSKGYTSDLDIEIKSVEEDQRRFTGIATAKSRDRAGDVVEPMGCQFAEEIPVFLNHDAREVVGIARLGKPTEGGVPFVATIAKIVDPGALKERCDDAWQMIKTRIIRDVSIGFQPIVSEPMREGGRRFLEIEILELSLVPIPAQPAAKILTTKEILAAAKAATTTAITFPEQRNEYEWPEEVNKHCVEMATGALEHITEARRELDRSHEGKDSRVTITQGQYNVLRLFPFASAAHAIITSFQFTKDLCEEMYGQIHARDETIKELVHRVERHKDHLARLEKKLKRMGGGE